MGYEVTRFLILVLIVHLERFKLYFFVVFADLSLEIDAFSLGYIYLVLLKLVHPHFNIKKLLTHNGTGV